MFLKLSQISLENTCAAYNVNVKIWLYAFSLHLNLNMTPAHICFPVSSAERLRRPFFLEHFWGSASDFIFRIFKSNKYMKVSFLFTFSTEHEESKTKQESLVALNLGNPRFA